MHASFSIKTTNLISQLTNCNDYYVLQCCIVKVRQIRLTVVVDLCLTGPQISPNQRATRKRIWEYIHSKSFCKAKFTCSLVGKLKHVFEPLQLNISNNNSHVSITFTLDLDIKASVLLKRS